MFEILTKLLPILLVLAIGVVLRKLNIVSKRDAETFLKMVFYIGIPAILIDSFSNISRDDITIYLPISSAIIISLNILISYLYSRFFIPPKKGRRINIIGASIMNNGLIIPFVDLIYGREGISSLLLLDFSNGILAFSAVYYVASSANGGSIRENIIKFFKTPPLIFLIISLLILFFEIKLPSPILDTAKLLSNLTIPLILLSLGIFLNIRMSYLRISLRVIALRVVPGLIAALALTSILNLPKTAEDIIIICGAAPVGFNLLTFASVESLDIEMSSAIVSFSILYGIITIPTILMILN